MLTMKAKTVGDREYYGIFDYEKMDWLVKPDIDNILYLKQVYAAMQPGALKTGSKKEREKNYLIRMAHLRDNMFFD